jgi:hypothetical protein
MPKRPKKQYCPPVSRKAATKLDVAHEQGVSLRTVDTWLKERPIPYRKFGPRLIRFDLDKVAAALERFTVKELS